jgi:hypothetical protein|tara:strand:- start:220 stop:1491 length:1272 start_codon:yes stop_codon:yes gene_type:complete
MAEKIKAKVIEVEEPSIQEKEEIVQKKAGFDEESGMYKVDLTQPPVTEEEQIKEETDAVPEQSTDEVPVRNESETSGAVQEGNPEEKIEEPSGEEDSNADVRDQEEEIPVIEEIIEDEQTNDDETAVVAEQEESQVEPVVQEKPKEEIEYPENIIDLVKFMNETGGTLEDYVALNKDYDQFEDMALLREYYQQSKPHLSLEEIDFLIEDDFSYDKEIDEPKVIKRKEVAFKEAVASAKKHLEGQKSTYYKEIKAGARLTPEQQKAMDFFNRYNEESAEQEKITQSQREVFNNKTNSLFNNQFKGFEYKIGEKRYRFNVKNVNEVKETQSDINNFAKRFLDKNNVMNDAAGYHKALFTGMHADAIAQHFYEQGKADAIKESVKSAKNIKMDARSGHQEIQVGGIKAKVISGDNLPGLKLKLKNY